MLRSRATRKYHNMDNVMTEKTWKQFKRWRSERRLRLRKKDYSYVIPHVEPNLAALNENRSQTTITWIGHSTFLLQIGGLNIVTDPVWAIKMALEKRLSPPGIPLQDMPEVDVVLISHSHYDHLHVASLRQLATERTIIIVPVGLKGKLSRKGFRNIVELQWWESITIDQVNVTFVPAQHWTRRSLTDMNRSHWGGYVLERIEASLQDIETHASKSALEATKKKESGAKAVEQYVDNVSTIYFVGDSGYFRGFKEIGERFDIDVTLMPIGAYEPEWFMNAQHVNPEEALQAFVDVGAKLMIPMHYGAFKLADDTPKEAIDRLMAERERLGIDPERVRLLLLGDTWKGQQLPVKSGDE
ncbi:MBL fold metallo-hydrolase [Paenibacillus sp. SC116]|uniref:MBL fold metallo-hydrolase n=1 Tax=Paenibacillus sp. SC116 TaxID=2968986 RepID=UPI00215B07F4|nr:MBL fold metallo-hydrolase [Paenibacillus sp. SC116]MCR8844226.1 MBL fold metallo-hydrolase [Paenibacillus sp. SC116]